MCLSALAAVSVALLLWSVETIGVGGMSAVHGRDAKGSSGMTVCLGCGYRYESKAFYPLPSCGNPDVLHKYCQACQVRERRRWRMRLSRYMDRLIRQGVIGRAA